MTLHSITAEQQRPTTTADADRQKRDQVHSMWAAVAGSWSAHADYTDRRHAPNTRRLLDLADPRPDDRVLELACGAGGLGLAAARLVGPDGEVVISDVTPGMTAAAEARASASGMGNVRTEVLDIEAIDQPDASYDVVLCRDGLQFAVDPSRAAREIHRVLRPGGRVAVAVWGPRPRNPWLGVVMDVISEQTGKQVPPPGLPGPFALEDAAELEHILTEAGLLRVSVSELSLPMYASSFEDWWSRTSALAGPASKLIASMPEPARVALRDRARLAVAPYETPGGLELPGVSLVASGQRDSSA